MRGASNYTSLKLFAASANRPLAESIARVLNVPISDMLSEHFSDGEIRVQIKENVRGADVFVVQSIVQGGNPSPNDSLMELLVILDAMKRASVGRLTAVLAYYPYARQDRKNMPRVPISAKLVADLIEKAGADRVVTMDLHAGQIQGFFSIPVDNLMALDSCCAFARDAGFENLVVVSPDAGGVDRARRVARRLSRSLAIIDKRRDPATNAPAIMHIVGDVRGKDCLIVDDMIDTAGTLCHSATALRAAGARRVVAFAVHGVLSGPALKRLNEAPIEQASQRARRLTWTGRSLRRT
eukprot:tig00000796_g4232.t1